MCGGKLDGDYPLVMLINLHSLRVCIGETNSPLVCLVLGNWSHRMLLWTLDLQDAFLDRVAFVEIIL